jgi:chromosome segregation ATPase
LETNIVAQKEEAKTREKILTDHIKERTNDLNQLEVEFGQEEKGLEEEIIKLKIHLEKAKRTKEVTKSQIMKKKKRLSNLKKRLKRLKNKLSH